MARNGPIGSGVLLMLTAILENMKQGGSQLAGFVVTAFGWIRRKTAPFQGVQAGFTIVETLIVLAVTGSMLIMAIAFISGRQNKTEFQTSINSLKQQLQQLINETQSGYYPNLGSFSCNGVSNLVALSAGSSKQGANQGCIFLGKVVQFGTGTGDKASELGIIPIVGKQYSSGTTLVQQVSVAKPRALYPSGSETVGTDSIDTEYMQYGLHVAAQNTSACPAINAGICYDAIGGGQESWGAIGVIAGDQTGVLNASDSAGTKPGFQRFSLYGINVTAAGQSIATVADAIGNTASTAPVNGLHPIKNAYICIESGTTNQSGLFTVTNDLHVTLKIYGNVTCS
jgi:type II secretory pathway pseudopilin PulG